MLDYESMIDERIAQLENEIEVAKKKADDQIERAMAEFIYQAALKSASLPESANLQKLFAEGGAEQYRKTVEDHRAKIAALQNFKARLTETEIKSLLAAELARLSALTYPNNL